MATDYLYRAQRLVSAAEAAVKELVAEALGRQDYHDVSTLAAICDALRSSVPKNGSADAEDDECARRLLQDVVEVLGGRPVLYTADALDALKALPTGPWRKFRGAGLTAVDLANMLSQFGLKPHLIRTGGKRPGAKVARGYRKNELQAALAPLALVPQPTTRLATLKEPRSTSATGAEDVENRQNGYPRFERESTRLIKIGWSQRDKRAYEHRAPKEVVLAVSRRLLELGVSSRVFKFDAALPIMHGSEEIPTYQAYLTLAWLRACGIVDKRGKDGYATARKGTDTATVEDCWNKLPERD